MRLIIHADIEPISARLNRLAVGLGDLQPVMNNIGQLLEESTELRISNTKTAPDGTPWRGLSAKTLAQKTGKSGKTRDGILVDTGSLMRSITHEASANSVIVGSGEIYARWHQQGTKHMPARPFLGLSETDVRDINEHLDARIAELLKDDK